MCLFRILIVVPIVVLFGCGTSSSTKPLTEHAPHVAKFSKANFDDQTKAILVGATKVEVFRTDGYSSSTPDKPEQPGKKRIGGIVITAQGQDQGKEFATKLANILFDERIESNIRAGCFWPGVAYRVWKDDEFVEILICFKCENFSCGTSENSTFVTFVGSPLRSALVGLAKEAFPDDLEIQGLGPKRE